MPVGGEEPDGGEQEPDAETEAEADTHGDTTIEVGMSEACWAVSAINQKR